jgi:hypothetical protein
VKFGEIGNVACSSLGGVTAVPGQRLRVQRSMTVGSILELPPISLDTVLSREEGAEEWL